MATTTFHAKRFWYLFLIAFVEGGCLMGTELVGAKLVAPYYGNSLYVWAAVLGLTLGGLATGYFLGGMTSKKYPYHSTLHLIVALSALLVALMPLTSSAIMEATLALPLRVGITISCLVFLFPPLVTFGMVSPMIIRLNTTEVAVVGRSAGTVYAISTFGGIVITFLFGFYFIPYIGLWQSCVTMAVALGIFPVGFFGKQLFISS
jgi:predicted membrane-bound spermidine synthase